MQTIQILIVSFLVVLCADANSRKPNVIYIICDDLGYSDIGCFGSEIETPNLDRLAEEGLCFRQHYTYAKCETSRAALMSGMFHRKCGNGIKGDVKTMGEVLQKAGYKTYISGKWHLSGNPVDRGFDGFYGLLGGMSHHFNPFGGGISRDHRILKKEERPDDFYTSDYFAGEGIKYIAQSLKEDPEKPVFLYLAFTAPHSPLQAPADLVHKYRGRYQEGWDSIRAARVAKQRKLGIFSEKWMPSDRNEDIPAWDTLDPELQDAEDFRMATFAAMVERVDWNIGRLLRAIGPDGLDIADNTLIYFVSDNGSSPYPRSRKVNIPPDDPNSMWWLGPAWAWMGNTPYRYYKQSQFNGGVLTPMIVRWPETIKQTGEIIDYPTHLIDVMSTLVDITGVDYAAEFPKAPSLDGVSIRSIFEGKPAPVRKPIGFEFYNRDFAYLNYPWKISSYRREPWQLFNLEADRAETYNLARKYPEKVDALAADALTWWSQRNEPTSNLDLFTGMEPDTSNYIGRDERYRNPLTQKRGTYSYAVPPVWTTSAIGDVAVSEIAEEGGTGLIRARLDGQRIGGTSDDFGFLHRPFSDDGELLVKIVSFEGCGNYARAGVMLRDGLVADAAFVMAEVNQNGAKEPTVNLRIRETAGASTDLLKSGISSPLPIWVRLVRSGDQFMASYSADGRHYTEVLNATLALPPELRSGIALNPQKKEGAGIIKVRDYEQAALVTPP